MWILHSSTLLNVFSFVQAPAQGGSPGKGLPSSLESFGMDLQPAEERRKTSCKKGETPPGQEKLLLGEEQVWLEAGGPPAPAACSSRASPAPSAGKNNARRDPAPPAVSPARISSMASFHLPQGPRVGRAEPSPSRGGRTTLSLGSQGEELPSHELLSTFASNSSSRLQRSKRSIAHPSYSPSDPPVGNLILLLACGQPSPGENALQIPRGCVAERDTAGDTGRRKHQLLPQQVPGKPGRNVKGIQGKQERFGSLVCCSALCKVVVLALPPVFPCLLGV